MNVQELKTHVKNIKKNKSKLLQTNYTYALIEYFILKLQIF